MQRAAGSLSYLSKAFPIVSKHVLTNEVVLYTSSRCMSIVAKRQLMVEQMYKQQLKKEKEQQKQEEQAKLIELKKQKFLAKQDDASGAAPPPKVYSWKEMLNTPYLTDPVVGEYKQQGKTKLLTISIVGLPNAGKSTFLNRIINRKVSAVSPKTHTTRGSIMGVCTEGDTQLCFTDTPGIVPPDRQNLQQKPLVSSAWASLELVDLVVVLIDSTHTLSVGLRHILERVRKDNIPAIAIYNKIDLVESFDKVLKLAEIVDKDYPNLFKNTFFISSIKSDNIQKLKEYLTSSAKESNWLYPAETKTLLSLTQQVDEIIREKIYRRFNKEVPYAVEQKTTSWRVSKEGDAWSIEHELMCNTAGQEKMVVSGMEYLHSRTIQDLERTFQKKVFLTFVVKRKPANRLNLTRADIKREQKEKAKMEKLDDALVGRTLDREE